MNAQDIIIQMVIGNSIEIWAHEKFEKVIAPSGFVTRCSPPGYFDVIARIDREKAQEHLETYEEFQARMRAHNRLIDGPIIC